MAGLRSAYLALRSHQDFAAETTRLLTSRGLNEIALLALEATQQLGAMDYDRQRLAREDLAKALEDAELDCACAEQLLMHYDELASEQDHQAMSPNNRSDSFNH